MPQLPQTSQRISLDDLMSESLANSKAVNDVKAARLALSKGGLAASESAAITASLREWEAKREWHPKAAVVMFARQKCRSCGQFHTQFLGFFQRQRHRTTQADRWIAHLAPQDDKLPREAKYRDSYAELCEDCAEHLGFDVEEGS